MTGREQLTAEVARLLEGYGPEVCWIHLPDSRRVLGPPGFPDFLIAGPRGILYRECKPADLRRLGPGQVAWKYMLAAGGGDYAVWGKRQLEDGTIAREIRGLLAWQ